MAQNNLADVAKFTIVHVLEAVPLIGNTAADIAQNIIDLAEKARHNRDACKYISARVQQSLRIIIKCKAQGNLEEQRKAYENVLREIEQYVTEIDKPGKFGEKAKKWLMDVANANNVEEASRRLLQRLTDATNDFYNSVVLDNNNKINEMQITMDDDFAALKGSIDENFAALKIMITQKGDSVTEEEIESLRIDPSRFDDDDDDDGDYKITINIRKRLYIGDEVAVKKLPNHDLQQHKIAKQAKIIRLLGACSQIEKFFGIYVENKNGTDYLFVVTEWMENGTLQEYLSINKLIQWKDKLKIAEQIAKGLNFCSGADVYHRDVRSKNVLLDKDLNAKLTNFEMSRKFKSTSAAMPVESFRWTAPEKVKYPKQPYTDKCEVYSFAVLLWEISSHKLPFDEVKDPLKACEKAKNKERPGPFSKDTPEQYRNIVEQAWQHDHRKRPTIDDIRKQLGEMRGGNRLSLKVQQPVRPKTPVPYDLDDGPLSIDQVILLHKEERYKDAFPRFLHLAQKGNNPLASYYAGLYLYEGPKYGIEKDEIKALQLFQNSADGGEAKGQYMYAYACLKGSYYSQEQGLKYLKDAALKNQNPDALYMVSQFFLNGEHSYPANYDKYLEYLTKATSKGSEVARSELATLKK